MVSLEVFERRRWQRGPVLRQQALELAGAPAMPTNVVGRHQPFDRELNNALHFAELINRIEELMRKTSSLADIFARTFPRVGGHGRRPSCRDRDEPGPVGQAPRAIRGLTSTMS